MKRRQEHSLDTISCIVVNPVGRESILHILARALPDLIDWVLALMRGTLAKVLPLIKARCS